MFNPRTALVLVAPLVCAALVACRASVGEDVRITGESEAVAPAESDPSSASPAPTPSDPMLAPAPSSSEPGGGAASEDAPPPSASADAGADASPDVAPKAPYTCTTLTMWSSASASPCSKTPRFDAGGELKAGSYYLSQWWSSNKAICEGTLEPFTRNGTMLIDVVDGVTYMRWTTSGTTYGSGTARLTPIDAASLERAELCGLSRGKSTTVDYWTSENDIVLARQDGSYEERWTKIPTAPWDPRNPIDIKQ